MKNEIKGKKGNLLSIKCVKKTECNTSVQTVLLSKDKHSNTPSKIFF